VTVAVCAAHHLALASNVILIAKAVEASRANRLPRHRLTRCLTDPWLISLSRLQWEGCNLPEFVVTFLYFVLLVTLNPPP
jgi:hypothetical protein